MAISISTRFSDIHVDDISRIKSVIESLGFKIHEIKPTMCGNARTFFFSINATLKIEDSTN